MATKLADVKIGDIWFAKISGKLTEVRIDKDRGYSHNYSRTFNRPEVHRGWDCTNLATGKVVTCHIQRLRRLQRRAINPPGLPGYEA